VTEQGNLTSDDFDVDDVIMNEEIVTTNMTHESHEHDDKDTSRQKKVTFDTHMVDDGNNPDAIEIGSWGDTPLVQPTVIFVKSVQNAT
jgi:hypothetical protein